MVVINGTNMKFEKIKTEVDDWTVYKHFNCALLMEKYCLRYPFGFIGDYICINLKTVSQHTKILIFI